MTDIYQVSLRAKYECVMRIVSMDLAFGEDLTALTQQRLELVHDAADQAIFDWATRRKAAATPLRPISNLQHLLDEYCAIADHM